MRDSITYEQIKAWVMTQWQNDSLACTRLGLSLRLQNIQNHNVFIEAHPAGGIHKLHGILWVMKEIFS